MNYLEAKVRVSVAGIRGPLKLSVGDSLHVEAGDHTVTVKIEAIELTPPFPSAGEETTVTASFSATTDATTPPPK